MNEKTLHCCRRLVYCCEFTPYVLVDFERYRAEIL